MDKKLKMINRFTFSFNPKKYIYLYKENIGKAFLYILMLSVILGGIQGALSTVVISNVEKTVKMFLAQENVKFEMKDGILDFKTSPLKQEEGQILLYVDTNKNLSEVDELKNITVHKEVAIVLLKDGLMIKQGSDEMNIEYKNVGLGSIDFNNDVVISILNKMYLLKYLIIPVIIIVKFIGLVLYALILSLVGVLRNLMSNIKFKYERIFNLSLYAVTLPALINAIYPLGSFTILIGGIILMFALSFITVDQYKENMYSK